MTMAIIVDWTITEETSDDSTVVSCDRCMNIFQTLAFLLDGKRFIRVYAHTQTKTKKDGAHLFHDL